MAVPAEPATAKKLKQLLRDLREERDRIERGIGCADDPAAALYWTNAYRTVSQRIRRAEYLLEKRSR